MNIKAIIKKNILAVVAVALITGFSAFKMAETPKSEVQTSQWLFQPAGSSTDQDDPDNYIPFNPSEHTDCGGSSESLCSIMAPEDGSSNKPLLDPNVPVTVNESFYSPTRRTE